MIEGCKYCPIVKKSTFENNKSSITLNISSVFSPRPNIMPDFVNIFLLISLADLSNSSEAEYWDPGLTFLYKLGTVSILWLKTSGLASITFL